MNRVPGLLQFAFNFAMMKQFFALDIDDIGHGVRTKTRRASYVQLHKKGSVRSVHSPICYYGLQKI